MATNQASFGNSEHDVTTHKDAKLSQILRRHLTADDATVSRVIDEINRAHLSPQVDAAKIRILKSVELHSRAEDWIEEEVSRYRKDLYVFAKSVAKNEMEEDIITKSHVMKAKQILWRRRSRYSFSDGFLALGGLSLGASITHIISLTQSPVQPNLVLIVSGIVGGFLFGMGIIGKARQN